MKQSVKDKLRLIHNHVLNLSETVTKILDEIHVKQEIGSEDEDCNKLDQLELEYTDLFESLESIDDELSNYRTSKRSVKK